MMMKILKTNGKVEQIYFDWLYDQIEERKSSRLKDFIFELQSFPFVCHIPNDDNRVEDGLTLRNQFIDQQDFDLLEDALSGPCTVLEMLIALAGRMDFILFDYTKGSKFKLWFWLFIDNLKLQKYTSNENGEQKKKFNSIVIRKFVDRDYQVDGRGGLFPLESPSRDQRDVEIWYQMMDYISENYDV
jgi:hypothetical protein